MKIVVRSWSLMFFFLIGQLSSYFANSWRIFRLNACFLPRTDVNQCSQGQLQIWTEQSKYLLGGGLVKQIWFFLDYAKNVQVRA